MITEQLDIINSARVSCGINHYRHDTQYRKLKDIYVGASSHKFPAIMYVRNEVHRFLNSPLLIPAFLHLEKAFARMKCLRLLN